MKLILMRHAKSAWDDPLMDDFDRPLTARGRRSADLLGQWLATNGHHPTQVLISGAKRTQETWEIAAPHLPTAELREERALYLASPDVMQRILARATGTTILMIAHNPGMASLASRLAGIPPLHNRFNDYPTGATTVMTFPAPSWSQIAPTTGQVLDFAIPRELETAPQA